MSRATRYDIAIDFDGVLHHYRNGWEGPTIISDSPVPGAIGWLNSLTLRGIRFCIFSARNKYKGGPEAMQKWLQEHGATVRLTQRDFPLQKPNANIFMDDHGMRFEGSFPTATEIKEFKSWVK